MGRLSDTFSACLMRVTRDRKNNVTARTFNRDNCRTVIVKPPIKHLPVAPGHKTLRWRCIVVLSCTLLAGACSGPLVVGKVYNSAAKQSAKQMKGLANFSKPQERTIDQRFAQYHSWHRQQQLPLYSKLLTGIANHIDSEQAVTSAITASWMQQINDFSTELRYCSPLNSSAEFLSKLSDSQVASIALATQKTHTVQVQKFNQENKQSRTQNRQKAISTWAGRAGLKLNKKQKQLLGKTLDQQISLGSQRYYLHQQWIAKFNQLLENRNSTNGDFAPTMNAHIHSLWTLTQDNYPSEWQQSATLWQNFLTEFLQLQTTRQNNALIKKARKFAATLDSLSKQTKNVASPKCFSPLR